MRDSSQVRELITTVIESSKVPSLEIYYMSSQDLQIAAYDGRVSQVTQARKEGIGVRAVADTRMGSAFTERIDAKSLRAAIKQAHASAEYMHEDPGFVLYPGTGTSVSERYYHPENDQISMDDKKSFVCKLEKAARSLDRKITSVPHAYYVESRRRIITAGSSGLFREQMSSSCGSLLQVVAKSGKDVQQASISRSALSFYELSPLQLALDAVMKALDKMKAKQAESGTWEVLFSSETASKLLGAFLNTPHSHVYGENIQKGRSRLAELLGKPAASKLFTVQDRPKQGTIRSRDFDDEGFPTKDVTLFFEGKFISPVHSIYSAKRGRCAPTGHGVRPGYTAGPATALHDPCLVNGEATLDDLTAGVDRGIYVTELEGLHAGFDPITGSFSLSARGFSIERGEIAAPLKQFTVAGNCFELIQRITAKANDRRDDRFTSFSSPSILVSSVSVSG